jgi:hypothetical protein
MAEGGGRDDCSGNKGSFRVPGSFLGGELTDVDVTSVLSRASIKFFSKFFGCFAFEMIFYVRHSHVECKILERDQWYSLLGADSMVC